MSDASLLVLFSNIMISLSLLHVRSTGGNMSAVIVVNDPSDSAIKTVPNLVFMVASEEEGQLTTESLPPQMEGAVRVMDVTTRSDRTLHGRASDCRINCKTASHGDGDRGTPVAP